MAEFIFTAPYQNDNYITNPGKDCLLKKCDDGWFQVYKPDGETKMNIRFGPKKIDEFRKSGLIISYNGSR